MRGVDFVVLPYAPGTDARLYLQPSLSLSENHQWHVFEYAAPKFSPKRYFEELEEYIQLHCHEELLVLVAHSASCRLSLDFLNKSMCYPDAIAWISPILEPSAAKNFLYREVESDMDLLSKLNLWCTKLLNKDALEVAHSIFSQGDFNHSLFEEFEDYLWKLNSMKIPHPCTKIPIFALSGGLDPLNSFEALSIQLSAFNNKTVTELTDIGHCPFIESPNVLSFLLEDFIQELHTSPPVDDESLVMR